MFGLTRRDWLILVAVIATLGVLAGLLDEATGVPALPVGMASGALVGVVTVYVVRRRQQDEGDGDT